MTTRMLPKNRRRTCDPATELRYVDDQRLHILVSYADHYRHLADECGVDHSPEFLTGQLAWGDAAREELADRERRGYSFQPGRGLFDRQLLEDIRQRIDLVGLIGQTVTLKPSGRAHIGDCPFHKSTSRVSFYVYPDAHYWCFGCREGGDVFDWLQVLTGGTFPETVRHAALLAGVDLKLTQQAKPAPKASGAFEYVGGTVTAR